MSKTAVGLFEHSGVAHEVVHDLRPSAFPRGEIRILGEPRDMSVNGAMSTPRIDFEVSLNRELQAIGANGARRLPTSKECGSEAFGFADRIKRRG